MIRLANRVLQLYRLHWGHWIEPNWRVCWSSASWPVGQTILILFICGIRLLLNLTLKWSLLLLLKLCLLLLLHTHLHVLLQLLWVHASHLLLLHHHGEELWIEVPYFGFATSLGLGLETQHVGSIWLLKKSLNPVGLVNTVLSQTVDPNEVLLYEMLDLFPLSSQLIGSEGLAEATLLLNFLPVIFSVKVNSSEQYYDILVLKSIQRRQFLPYVVELE